MREKLMRFMSGRYGNDNLNNFLIYSALILIVLNIFIKSSLLTIVSYLLWGWSIYRMFSRKVYQRNNENIQFLTRTKPLRHRFSCLIKGQKDKNNRYFTCPRCAQIVRVPKGRGKIEITCPACHTRFDKKS